MLDAAAFATKDELTERLSETISSFPAFHLAAQPGLIILPMAEALLKGGADINARDRNGRSALMYAVRHKQRATPEFLLRHGADASAKDNAGATALQLAQQLGFETIARTLSAAEDGGVR